MRDQSNVYHGKKIVKSANFGWDFGEFLVECIGYIMGWVSGYDQDSLSHFRQLHCKTRAATKLQENLISIILLSRVLQD
jgi:hypothetical protein